MVEGPSTGSGENGDPPSGPPPIGQPLGAGGPGARSGARRVLIVDDDDPVRETLADLLEDEGYCPVQACNATEAMVILRARPVDILVTDLSMPGEDGIALIRAAKLTQAGLPAILLTGYAEAQAAVSMIAGSRCHVLRKPVEANHLLTQIALLLKAR